MIDRDKLATAARTTDLRTEQIGMEAWCDEQHIILPDLMYVSEQRALRAAMLFIDGVPPAVLQRIQASGEKTPVRLSQQARDMLPVFAACIIDGIAIGKTVED